GSEAGSTGARRRRTYLSLRRSLPADSGVSMIASLRKVLAAAVLLVFVSLAAAAPAAAQVVDPQYLEAKRLFDALDYENAVRSLDQVIAPLLARPVQDPARRELLPSAYEMRARSKFALG